MTALPFLTALLNSPAPPVLTRAEWDALLAELQAEHLRPFVYARLRSTSGWRELPEQVRQALAEGFQTHSLRTYLMQAELSAIVDALAAVDVPVMLLKGAAVGRMVYGSPAERPIGDLDLLIPAGRLETARAALGQRGYQASSLYWLARWQQRYRAELPMVCQAAERQGLLVELHWSLVELPYYIDRLPMAEIWQASAPAGEPAGARLPDAATALLHCCAHWALHHSQEQRLLWLLDVDRLARHAQLDWDLAMDRAARWGLQLALRTIVLRAEAQLGSPVPEPVRAAMAHWRPAPVEVAMWGLGDERPGRTRRRVAATWAAMTGGQRVRYAAWLVLRTLLWEPENLVRTRRSKAPQAARPRVQRSHA